MRVRAFLSQLHQEDIVGAIRQAEAKTSGQIRVFISRHPVADPFAVAQGHFMEMGMDKTGQRNAVLLFVAPRSHNFAIIGDTGVHARCGEGFWRDVAAEITTHFRRSDFTGGILQAVRKAGRLLAEHFPQEPGGQNELSDEVAHD